MGYVIYKKTDVKIDQGRVFEKDVYEAVPSWIFNQQMSCHSDAFRFVEEISSEEDVNACLKKYNSEALFRVPEEGRRLFEE